MEWHPPGLLVAPSAMALDLGRPLIILDAAFMHTLHAAFVLMFNVVFMNIFALFHASRLFAEARKRVITLLE